MKTTYILGAVALTGALAIVGSIAFRNTEPEATSEEQAAVPADGPRIVYARRFETADPFHHEYRRERPLVDSGWLLVIDADKELLRPRQTLENLVCVGAQTAERVNTGAESGRLVLIVPGDFELENAPVYFGSLALPEAMTREKLDAELAIAVGNGVGTASKTDLAACTESETLRVPTEYELRLAAIDLVEQHSPQERDLISGWRVPRVK